jgi:hypothetical protein
MSHENNAGQLRSHCCPCAPAEGISRRGFLGGAAFGGIALTGLSWSALQAAQGAGQLDTPPPRKPLTVKPIFLYSTPKRRERWSWRNWGGIETQAQADEEVARIQGELAGLEKAADFPVQFLPIAAIRSGRELAGIADIETADAIVAYPAGGGTGDVQAICNLGKDTIIFVRHKSGPLYLWYEIISPRLIRAHTDQLVTPTVDFGDVVVDDQHEILWRLRALCGLRNTVGSRIVAVGGPGGWAQPRDKIVELVHDRWQLDIRTVSYDELGELIKAAREDKAELELALRRAEAYLKLPGTSLETKREWVDNGFVLEQLFRKLMAQAECRAMTINQCMGTIMPLSDTTACLPLSTLNDDGYLAFCESDFVVVPTGILMGNITGQPPFLHNPTYPHGDIITLAHCTAPRKMDGKNLEPARIVTHFESDFGVAPKVNMRKGQQLTSAIPDFSAEQFYGLTSEIVDHPFLPICRSQIDVRFECDPAVLAQHMRGFHWMTVYGDYMKEVGYALKKIPIQWEVLS